MTTVDKLLLRKRSIIETINDPLKNISQLEHSRHRGQNYFMVNLLRALITYAYQNKKPVTEISRVQAQHLSVL